MTVLRLTESILGPGRFSVGAVVETDGTARQTATSAFSFTFTSQDREDLRWYLEDYLEHPADPAPLIATRIESRMAAIGSALFDSVFPANDGFRDLWPLLHDELAETRIEIITPLSETSELPWELLCDPETGRRLALDARTFVRAGKKPAHDANQPRQATGRTRILLVTSRPNGANDLPFRSVASRLIKGLGAHAPEKFQLNVLRPPTFRHLAEVLREAKAVGEPYHVVHFDGHGIYEDLNALYSGQPPTDARGYLAFENAAFRGNEEFIHGRMLGSLLAENDVPMLVLNACRSAYAESPAEPVAAPPNVGASTGLRTDAVAQAYGSLAQEVIDAGVLGVVAMRYSVYVATAAQFVASLYERLASGQTLGEAVTASRKQLATQPLRDMGYSPRPLQDWMVPIVYESAPVAISPKVGTSGQTISIRAESATPGPGALAALLQTAPEAGFFGRDGTLFLIDRAFDTERVVLLHAFAGSGKSATAAEFARWYRSTGGIEGPVLFTSFTQRKTLISVLDEAIEPAFGKALELRGRPWAALGESERMLITLEILKETPALWIWDEVELVAGFLSGVPSEWSDSEQRALADFLRSAHNTKARFLLTSRRDERAWLSDAVQVRCKMPPMPLTERIQLAKALAHQQGRELTDVTRWIPLLRFADGNPLTITLLVRQALRDGLETDAQIEAFVARVRAGEAAFEDEEREGRSRSLGASLKYGFEQSFNEGERRQLSLLHLFHRYLNADVLFFMCRPGNPNSLPELNDATGSSGMTLLARAAEIGLLTAAFGTSYFALHPALPWFLKPHFDRYYRGNERAAGGPAGQHAAEHAFADAIGQLGEMCLEEFQNGNREFLNVLEREEENLLYARGIALANEWWSALIDTMQGLRVLYDQSGRHARWSELVREIAPLFQEQSGRPLPGRERGWALVTDYRVDIARAERNWEEAERLQQILVKLRAEAMASRQDTEALLARARDLEHLGDTLRWRGDPACVHAYEESLEMFAKVDVSAGVSCAFNLGHAFMDIPVIQNLDKAEQWYSRALELAPPNDRLGRSLCCAALANVAFMRGMKSGNAPESSRYLAKAIELNTRALAGMPPDAHEHRGVILNKLAVYYQVAGDPKKSLVTIRDAITAFEKCGMRLQAARARYVAAQNLQRLGQSRDALEYARSARSGLRHLTRLDAEGVALIGAVEAKIVELERTI